MTDGIIPTEEWFLASKQLRSFEICLSSTDWVGMISRAIITSATADHDWFVTSNLGHGSSGQYFSTYTDACADFWRRLKCSPAYRAIADMGFTPNETLAALITLDKLEIATRSYP